MSDNKPLPDFTLWEDNLFNMDNHRQNSSSGLDDATIVDFYDNQISIRYDAKGLLDILKKNLSPLTKIKRKQLKNFLRTPMEEGKNPTANSFSSFVHSVAGFTYWWNKKIKTCIKYLEDLIANQMSELSEEDDEYAVEEVSQLLSNVFPQFHYSPCHLYMVTDPDASRVFTLFGTQISALYMDNIDDLSIDRDTLPHKLAQIFIGHDVGDVGDKATQHSLYVYPHNCIFYECVLVMCGSMIDLFIKQGFLKWTTLDKLEVSKTCRGNDGVVVFPPPIFSIATVYCNGTTRR
jgi:hypothetical protein